MAGIAYRTRFFPIFRWLSGNKDSLDSQEQNVMLIKLSFDEAW